MYPEWAMRETEYLIHYKFLSGIYLYRRYYMNLVQGIIESASIELYDLLALAHSYS